MAAHGASALEAVPERAAPRQRGQIGIAWHRFRRHRPAMLGLAAVVLLVLAATFAPALAPASPTKTHLLEQLQPPSRSHLMGTDELGRDLFSRMLYGGRVSLEVGFLSMLVAIGAGIVVGAFAGYFPGWPDNLLMRLTDFAIALPQLFILILLASLFGTSVRVIVLVIGLLRWMSVARLVRGSFLSLREKEFVEAARTLGAGSFRIMTRHILLNALGPIIVAATLSVAGAIITESSLSFLGFGVPPNVATWGNMLRSAQDILTKAWWAAFFPGLLIFITVIAINYVGDGLRDAVDPKHVT